MSSPFGAGRYPSAFDRTPTGATLEGARRRNQRRSCFVVRGQLHRM